MVATVVGAFAMSTAPSSSAQSLHAPSRTLFKCQVQGKTLYSDSPCLGAEKLEVEPTRGVNKLSGKERIGADVQRELHREMFAEAIRSLTGMNAKQFDVQVRRGNLPWPVQQECRRLDQDLVNTEYEEKHTAQPSLHGVQERLLMMRQRFRALRC
jgi:hypothetical protein